MGLVGLHPALPTCRVRNCLTAVSTQTASVTFTPLGRQSATSPRLSEDGRRCCRSGPVLHVQCRATQGKSQATPESLVNPQGRRQRTRVGISLYCASLPLLSVSGTSKWGEITAAATTRRRLSTARRHDTKKTRAPRMKPAMRDQQARMKHRPMAPQGQETGELVKYWTSLKKSGNHQGTINARSQKAA